MFGKPQTRMSVGKKFVTTICERCLRQGRDRIIRSNTPIYDVYVAQMEAGVTTEERVKLRETEE
jgi:hypothetical protein